MVGGEDGARLKNQAQEYCEYVKREGERLVTPCGRSRGPNGTAARRMLDCAASSYW